MPTRQKGVAFQRYDEKEKGGADATKLNVEKWSTNTKKSVEG